MFASFDWNSGSELTTTVPKRRCPLDYIRNDWNGIDREDQFSRRRRVSGSFFTRAYLFRSQLPTPRRTASGSSGLRLVM